jgi:hypothetical protein
MEDINIEDLILNGVLEVAAVDSETGELLYNFTPLVKDLMPDLYRVHADTVYEDILFFWEEGFLQVNDFTEQNPTVRLTTKAFNDAEILKLNPDKRQSLNEIKRILKVV